MVRNRKIIVTGAEIRIKSYHQQDYICITDMIKIKDGDFFISDWLRNRNTLEYLGTWESMHNQNFNYGEFAIITNKSGLHNFKISVKEWNKRTNAIGLVSTTGRYGGTFAHKDLAFEFGTWISPQFKLYLIKEFQRLKQVESNQYNLEWNVKRILSKVNYQIQTDSIQQNILPKLKIPNDKQWLVYAEEADIINMVLFSCTAKQWRDANPQRAKKGENIRDIASINELAVLSNLESLNATMIRLGENKERRFDILRAEAAEQLLSLNNVDFIKSLKFTSDLTYIEASEQKNDEKQIEEKKLSNFNKSLKKALNSPPPKEKKD